MRPLRAVAAESTQLGREISAAFELRQVTFVVSHSVRLFIAVYYPFSSNIGHRSANY